MSHFELADFLWAVIGILGLISLCLLAFGRLGLGSIVAFLVAGIAIGEIRETPLHTVTALREFAELGVILLLFLIGLETQPQQLRRLGRDALSFGVPQIVLSALAIGLYAWFGFAGWEAAVVLGLGFALSSTVVVVQLLTDRGELDLPWGRKAFAILLAQDLAIVPLLLIVSLLAEQGSGGTAGTSIWWASLRALAVVAGIVIAGRFGFPQVLAIAERQGNQPAFVCVTLLGVLAAALAAETAGLSMALGTFLLGVTLSVSPLGHRIVAAVEPVKSALLALFFLSVGLGVDLRIVSLNWAPLLMHTGGILLIKFAVLFGLATVLGLARADALRLSLALIQCGEFGFVLFGAAQVGGLLTAELSALASILIILSMAATPLLVRLGDRLAIGAVR
jgi:glutathione-regulated potassium-efflux system ancillary protein KefC